MAPWGLLPYPSDLVHHRHIAMHMGLQRRRISRYERRPMAYRGAPNRNHRAHHISRCQKREEVGCTFGASSTCKLELPVQSSDTKGCCCPRLTTRFFFSSTS
jgi:hypothetical protein